jgi:hypothetical protein
MNKIDDFMFNTKAGVFIALLIVLAIICVLLTLMGLSYLDTFVGGTIIALIAAKRDIDKTRWF